MISQNDEKVKSGYWSIIPYYVIQDTEIRPNAKIMYAVISSMIKQTGYCFAEDDFFQDLFKMTKRGINNLISDLERRQYIHVEMLSSGNQHEKGSRQIWTMETWLVRNICSQAESAQEQNFRAQEQNFQDTINNKYKYIPPIVPHGGQGVSGDAKPKRKHREDYKQQADHLPERFERFWQFYCDSIPDDRRKAGNRQKAIKAWDKLSPAPGLIHIMGIALAEQVKGQSWQEGIGIPHASTWLNGHCWEDAAGSGTADQPTKEGWD